MAKEKDALTARDIDILRRVREHRLLRSRDHLLRLFGGRAARRAGRLADLGYLYRLPRRGQNEQDVFALGNRGSDLLADRFGLPRPKVDWTLQNSRLKEGFLYHTLLVADIAIRIEVSCTNQKGVRFIPPSEIFDRGPARRRWNALRHLPSDDPFRIGARIRWDGELIKASIYPDWLFGLEIEGRERAPAVYFFVEADRGTMPVTAARIEKASIVKKLLVYYEANRRQAEAPSVYEAAFGLRSIRTLFVIAPDGGRGTHGGERLKSCLKAARDVAGGQGSNVFLFAGQEFVQAENPLVASLVTGRGEETVLMD